MKYSDARDYAQQLRDLADFIEQHGVELPSGYPQVYMNCYLTETDYIRDPETGEYESKLNEDKTKQNLKRFLSAVGPCEKDYAHDRIKIVKRNSLGNQMVIGSVERSLACKKVVTGTKLVPATLIQARIEEEYEWQCDENVSLLKLVN